MTVLKPDALAGKVVLVSGGTQGVGAAVARTSAACGAAAVVISGRHPETADAVVDDCARSGADVMYVRADVAAVEQALATVAAVVDEWGRIDCVVNAAGLVDRGSLLDTTPEQFDRHIAVNLRAPFFIMQAAVADMLRRGESGSIVNLISISEHTGQANLAPYSAAKGGLATLTRNTALAHRWDRIRINGLNIGWTATEGEDRIQRAAEGAGDDWLAEAGRSLPAGRLADPAEIADMVVFLLSDASGIVTGSVIDWDQQVMGSLDGAGSRTDRA